MCLINITIEPTKFAAIFSNYIRISFVMCLVQSSCWDDRWSFLFLESHNCRRVVTIYYSKWSFKENLFCLISSTPKSSMVNFFFSYFRAFGKNKLQQIQQWELYHKDYFAQPWSSGVFGAQHTLYTPRVLPYREHTPPLSNP